MIGDRISPLALSPSVRRLARELSRPRERVLGAALALAALGATQLALTWVVKRWVDGVLLHDAAAARNLVPFAGSLVLAMAVLLYVSRTLLVSLSQETLRRLRDAAAERLLSARLDERARFAHGDLVARVFEDAALLSGLYESLLHRLAGDALLLCGAAAMMFALAPRLALVALVLAPLVGLLLSALGRSIRRRGRRAREGAGVLTAILSEQVRGVTAIRGLLAEKAEAERFAESDRAYVNAVLSAERRASLLIASVFAAAAAGFVLAVDAGGRALAAQAITPGALLAFCLYAGQTVEPLRRLAEVQGLLQRALGAAERLFETLDLPLEPDVAASAVPRRLAGALRVEGLRFRHQKDVPLLEGVDLTIPEGERLALASASGAGKSTLAQLLVRLHLPQGGRILLGEVDRAEAPLRDVRRAIHVVEPEPFLFAGSLLSNLRLGAPSVSRRRAAETLETVGLGPLLATLPRGVDERMGDGGHALSTGEKARVALARAILLDPSIVVFDEATAALDGDTEDELFDAIAPWLALRSALVISHRLATLRRCPRLALLAHGTIAAVGRFSDVEASRLFATIVGRQAEAASAGGDILSFGRSSSVHEDVWALSARGEASHDR